MVMPASAVLLTPLDGAFLLVCLFGLLSMLGVRVAVRLVFSSHSANRGMPRIFVSMEASFFRPCSADGEIGWLSAKRKLPALVQIPISGPNC